MNAHFFYFIRIARIFKEEILVFIEILKFSVFENVQTFPFLPI